jgi:cell division protein FtsZ
MDPEIGKKAAEETKSEIQDVVKGADMIFLACGMGGGTGTGAAPIVARAAKEQGILTVAVVTKPFFFEGNHRMKIAEKGIEELAKEVDAIIIIPNDKLLQLAEQNTNFKDAFVRCDNVLRQAVEGISDLITTPGVINVDFADIKAVMENAGSALMGIGNASGEKRAEKAALAAINSPLLEISIHGAKGVLFAISGGDDLTINEIQDAAKIITESIDKDAKVIFGTIHDDSLKKGEIKVTVIATSFPADMPRKSLFGGAAGILLKDEAPAVVKKEIHNSFQNGNLSNNNDFIKKPEPRKEVKEVKEDIIEDDGDDWSAVPAFLRRNKK